MRRENFSDAERLYTVQVLKKAMREGRPEVAQAAQNILSNERLFEEYMLLRRKRKAKASRKTQASSPNLPREA